MITKECFMPTGNLLVSHTESAGVLAAGVSVALHASTLEAGDLVDQVSVAVLQVVVVGAAAWGALRRLVAHHVAGLFLLVRRGGGRVSDPRIQEVSPRVEPHPSHLYTQTSITNSTKGRACNYDVTTCRTF